MIRSPLLQFFVLGAALFAAGHFLGGSKASEEDRILVTRGEVDQLVNAWQLQWRRPPSEDELRGLVESYVREEIFYREALAMGLDRDDTVVRRRMAQKLQFIAEDLATQREPTDVELERWFTANEQRYRASPSYSFEHVYLSRDRRGERARTDAVALLEDLRSKDESVDPAMLGDPFMLAHDYASESKEDVARLFGQEFAEALAEVSPGQWEGPVSSGYGLHLVRVHEIEEAHLPAFSEVRQRVRGDYFAEKKREANDAFYEALRDRYQVEFEELDSETPAP